MEWVRRNHRAAWALLFAVLFSFTGYAVTLPGTTVCGIDVGGLTVSAAASRLKVSLEWHDRKVTLTSNGRSRQAYLAADLGIEPDYNGTAKACRRPLWMFLKRNIPLVIRGDAAQLSSFATGLAEEFNVEVRDARLGLGEGDRVVVVPEVAGRSLDFGQLKAIFLATGTLEALPETIEIPFIDVAPKVLAGDLERYLPMERVASFATSYATGNDRAFNIDLASLSLRECVVRPGGTFSFNNAVGQRTEDRGYRKAPIFVGDETVDDYGGGICQISTTLYVALLKAGFQVAERYSHSKPVDYVPMGLDATVTFGYLDLKMTNPGDAPCLVRVAAKGGELRADVFGKRVEDLSIEIESRVLREFPAQDNEVAAPIPPNSAAQGPDGQKKLRNGYLVETIRKYIRGGGLEKVERLDTSMYPPEKPKTR